MLQVPQAEKNFLLSPPGSPPVGWVQLQESGPAQGGHSQLHDVWHELMNENFSLDAGSDGPTNNEDDTSIPSSQITQLSGLGPAYEDEERLEARSNIITDDRHSHNLNDGGGLSNRAASRPHDSEESNDRIAGTRIDGGEVIWPLRRDDLGSVPMIVLESSEGDIEHDPGDGSRGLESLANRSSTPTPRELPRTARPPIL